MTDWHRHFMRHAELIAQVSKDPARKVGAIIVDGMRRMVGSGYNGFPRGVRDLPERYENDYVKLKLVVHAEANAILNSAPGGVGFMLYCTSYPCSECAKLIIQAGILRVMSPPPKTEGKWAEDAQFSGQMFAEAMVTWMEAP